MERTSGFTLLLECGYNLLSFSIKAGPAWQGRITTLFVTTHYPKLLPFPLHMKLPINVLIYLWDGLATSSFAGPRVSRPTEP